jgi:hypothetical protein
MKQSHMLFLLGMAGICGCSAVFATRLAARHLQAEKAQLASAQSTLLTRRATLQKQTAALADGSQLVQQKQDLGKLAREISKLELTVIPLATRKGRNQVLRDELQKLESNCADYLNVCRFVTHEDLQRGLQSLKASIAKVDARIAELNARR